MQLLPTGWPKQKISQHDCVIQNFVKCNSYLKVAESQIL